ncbi:TetR/AcrR family transcriptional regulator [Actinoplanes sp. RD1]|uniref:TetR/AcrR family transcriptional regulator n=1 Tax=Actinoplanes sp. RD1 TaxID=3064538 RepID=UPI00274039B1|nr:TetR/AcrR family transcriptional regulator [Actinoplanes sp. RD1]
MTTSLPQPLRSDARDNRERILEAARDIFAREGLDVPMREIARRAGVGPATLYRRFPTKEALVTEAFAERMAACTAIVEAGLADPDPWRGLSRVIEQVCQLHAQDRGFTAAFMAEFPKAIDFAASRERSLRLVAELLRRAKAAGQVRPDLELPDIMLVIMANGGLRATSPAASAAASRRFASLILDSFRAPG